MKKVRYISLLVVLFLSSFSLYASSNERDKNKELDIPEIVLEHLSDAYEWHVATYQGKHLSLPLPIIVKSGDTGEWYVGTAHNLPNNFFFDAQHHGKIYERHADGSTSRPLDLSVTKAVAQIWIVVGVLLIVFLSCARWYKKVNEKSEAPKGFVGLIEMLVMYIHDDLIKPAVGERHYKRYAPFLLTVFFFIFTCNLVGLVPVFPGGANVTGNINITMFLAVTSMLVINIFANKEYWKEVFLPEVPMALKFPVPLMPVIEVFSIFTKPFALMIRLFANMMAGHAIILSFTCVIFLGWNMGVGYGLGLNLLGIIMLLFMNCLELLVAFVQAYVFTMLSAVFIGMAHKEHHSAE